MRMSFPRELRCTALHSLAPWWGACLQTHAWSSLHGNLWGTGRCPTCSCSSLHTMCWPNRDHYSLHFPDGQTASGGGSGMPQRAFCPTPAFPAVRRPRARLDYCCCCSVTIALLFCYFFFFFSVTMSYPTLWDPRSCSLLVSSVHGISQARILKWVAISFSRGLSDPRLLLGKQILHLWATREVH